MAIVANKSVRQLVPPPQTKDGVPFYRYGTVVRVLGNGVMAFVRWDTDASWADVDSLEAI